MRRFTHEVELLGEVAREFGDHFARPQALAVGPEALDEARTGVHQRQVFRDHPHHAGP